MRYLLRYLTLALALLLPPSMMAQHQHPSDGMKPAALETGLGDVHLPVSTANQEAQRFFDQGLAFIYAFNHEEAVRSFKRAAELDPKLAMAHWGVALALGSNYNLQADSEQQKAAYASLQKALSLSAKAPANERAYIEALSKRYSDDPQADLQKLAAAYKSAMSELVARFPDDLDAATLYAESMMNLRPWKLWTADGKPAAGTEEIISVLEAVLRRNPNHTGANHYYIHAVEASRNPERALPSAAVGMSFWTDAAILAEAGIPSILFGPTGAGLHSVEEYVDVDSVLTCRDVLVETVQNLVRA